MKKYRIYHAIAPVIALFAVGCSSPIAMQSTEYDDMYYSSSDRTEYVQPQAQAQEQRYASANEGVVETQPSTSNVTEDYYADEYYDGRTYRPQATWNTPNYAYVDPYWTTSHVRRFNRYNAFYDPYFYDPFYDPFLYDPFFPRGGGLRVGIGIGIGHAWGGGWNRWGNPYYDPYFGSRWWPYNNYYSGFYHGYNHGFYGSGIYGNRYIYDRPFIVQQPRQVQYGPRNERGGVPVSGGERASGRPNRTQSVSNEQQAANPNVDYARPGRADRSGVNTRGGQQVNPVDDTKQVLPARPGAVGREARPSRQQPVGTQPGQRMSPSRESNVAPAQQYRPVQRQERTQPTQRQQQPVRQYRSSPSPSPSYERSQPVRTQPSYQPSRSSGGSYSPPARTNSGGGGRPGRGGN